jgi:hypothetical protein
MASNNQVYCVTCKAVPWFQLQPEDVSGTPHHASRRALEESAKSCSLCRLVLKAAVSSYKDTRGVRNKRGYWREFIAVTYHDFDGSVRKVTYVKELGACMPVSFVSSTEAKPIGRPVLAATGAPDPEQNHVDEVLNLEGLSLDEPPDDMPVWVYGNIWAAHMEKKPGDMSHMRLVGVGARFARDKGHFNVFEVPKDDVKLCGSLIGLCTDDGELWQPLRNPSSTVLTERHH